MKALILNSGVGSRMLDLTSNKCKCMVEVSDNLLLVDMQIRALVNCGITDIIMTTGPFADELEEHLCNKHPEVVFSLINNPLYDKTNYIYSIYLAKDFLQEDILLLHGDLVFEESVLRDVLTSGDSVMVVDSTKPLPEKDFKAVVKKNKVRHVSIDVFDDAYYAQPLYKLLKQDWLIWLDEIIRFCDDGITNVYAENAFNNVSFKMNVRALDVLGRICFEIDDKNDLENAKDLIALCL